MDFLVCVDDFFVDIYQGNYSIKGYVVRNGLVYQEFRGVKLVGRLCYVLKYITMWGYHFDLHIAIVPHRMFKGHF